MLRGDSILKFQFTKILFNAYRMCRKLYEDSAAKKAGRKFLEGHKNLINDILNNCDNSNMHAYLPAITATVRVNQ